MAMASNYEVNKGPTPRPPRACGCKGIRSCLLCMPEECTSNMTMKAQSFDDGESIPRQEKESASVEDLDLPRKRQFNEENKINLQSFDYCYICGKAWLLPHENDNNDTETVKESNRGQDENSSDIDLPRPCDHGTRLGKDFCGIDIYENFVNEEEESTLDEEISKTMFMNSQSGRRKQDFGPKVNFKKRKLRTANFNGLPHYSHFLYERMLSVPGLADFHPVEMCNLEYVDQRGAHIDPHFDDFWLWGERLVTLNLVSSSTLSFTADGEPGVEVRVPMPQRSLIVVSGPARHQWKHAIRMEDIVGRRIATTFRELSAEFQEAGPRHEEGQALLDLALTFKGCAIGGS